MKSIYRILLLLVFVVVSGILAGCGTPLRSERASADWSRGVLLGQAGLNAPVAMASTVGGDTVLAWVGAPGDDDAVALHLVQVDVAGQVVVDHDLAFPAENPTQVGLAPAGSGELHIFWIDKEGDIRRLLYSRLDAAGNALYAPEPISPLGIAVSSYTLLPGDDGQVHIFWSCEEGDLAGLYYSRLGVDGARLADNATLQSKGYDAAACVDRDGEIHLVWSQRPDYGERAVYYARFDPDAEALVSPRQLALYAAPLGIVAHSPEIGLARDDVYVFWALERRGGGVSNPSADSYFMVFPQDRPELVIRPERLVIPADNHPDLDEWDTGLPVRDLAAVPDGVLPSTFVYLASASRTHEDVLPVAYAVQIDGRTKSTVQIVLAVWRDGEILGYQIAGKTANFSGQPRLLADGRGNLNLAWLDTAGFGTFDVYYASTAEAMRSDANRLTGRDVGSAVLSVLWGVAQAVGMLPIAFIWLFLPLILVVIYVFLRAESDMAERGPRVMLVVAAVLYTTCKYLFQPNWLAALPLPRQLSAGAANAFMYAVPVVISLLAAGITVLYIRRRQYASLLPSFLVFVAADALVTLLLYVPGILAE